MPEGSGGMRVTYFEESNDFKMQKMQEYVAEILNSFMFGYKEAVVSRIYEDRLNDIAIMIKNLWENPLDIIDYTNFFTSKFLVDLKIEVKIEKMRKEDKE